MTHAFSRLRRVVQPGLTTDGLVRDRYTIDNPETICSSLGSDLHGRLSPPSEITLPYAERYVTSSPACDPLRSTLAALNLRSKTLGSEHRRQNARIPSTATHFFWAHGIEDRDRSKLDKLTAESRKSIAEQHWYFMTFGAFIYVKAFKDDLSDCNVIGINALSPDEMPPR